MHTFYGTQFVWWSFKLLLSSASTFVLELFSGNPGTWSACFSTSPSLDMSAVAVKANLALAPIIAKKATKTKMLFELLPWDHLEAGGKALLCPQSTYRTYP